MTNPQLGHAENANGQSQPEVTLNAQTRKITAALASIITIDFESDANYTLAADNAAPQDDQWPFRTIRMTDTGTELSGAVDVIYPDVDTEYSGTSRLEFWFENGTAQILTIKRSGQTGVAVAAGAKALVRHNGTDIEAVTLAESVAIQIAASDESTAIDSTGTKATFRSPKAFALTGVRASLTGACTTGTFTVDINVNGSTILSTKLTIDATESTSTTAATPAVISSPSIPDDAEITIDVDDAGDDTATGLKVTLLGVG